MRADERDIGRYFRRKIEIEVRDVILLRDKRTGRHKGCAYVEEVRRLEDMGVGGHGEDSKLSAFSDPGKACRGRKVRVGVDWRWYRDSGRVTVIHPPSLKIEQMQ